MKVLITGATGFVGGRLVENLTRKNHQIRALVRGTSRVNGLSELGVELCYGDITDLTSLKNAVKGVDAVIHMASTVGESGDRRDFFRVNVEGTKNILEAARGEKIKRFIHISSLSVITGYRDHDGTKEEAPYLPTGENYADTKIEAEKLVLRAHQDWGLPVTVLRPGFIFGPGDHLFLPTVIQNLKNGKVILIDHGKKLLNLTYVENLIEAILLALEKDAAIGEIFNVTDGEEISKKRFFDTVADLTGLARPQKSIPFPVAKALCETITLGYRALHIKKTPPISRMKLRFAGQNQWFDISKAEKILGYKHQVSFEEGIQNAVKWFQENRGS